MTEWLEPDTAVGVEPGAVVVGVDGTDTALHAAVWAAGEAAVRGVPVRILHAAPYAANPADGAGRRHARGIVDRARTLVRRQVPAAESRTLLSTLPARDALTVAARDAGLLVLGLIPTESPVAPVLGSITPAVTSDMPCPVVVVRGTAQHRPGAPVVVGVHTTADDAAALTAAFEDAARHGSGLVVVHAGDTGRDELAAALGPWRDTHPGVPVEYRVGEHSPRDAVLDAARTARLVVVGTHRRSSTARLLFGSTSQEVLRLSPVPVQIVRPEPATQAAR